MAIQWTTVDRNTDRERSTVIRGDQRADLWYDDRSGVPHGWVLQTYIANEDGWDLVEEQPVDSLQDGETIAEAWFAEQVSEMTTPTTPPPAVCPRCGYTWQARVTYPVTCPNPACQRPWPLGKDPKRFAWKTKK